MTDQKPTNAPGRSGASGSTGPKTPEGKLRSSMNAFKHGKYARSFYVLRHEDREEFERLVDRLSRCILPENSFEYHLVRNLAFVEWRLQRVFLMDTCILDREFEAKQSSLQQAGIECDAPTNLGAATHSILEASKLPGYLASRESQLIYARSSILQTIRQLRKGRTLSEPDPQIVDPMDVKPDGSFQNEPGSNPPQGEDPANPS